jgi:hypothetical protein
MNGSRLMWSPMLNCWFLEISSIFGIWDFISTHFLNIPISVSPFHSALRFSMIRNLEIGNEPMLEFRWTRFMVPKGKSYHELSPPFLKNGSLEQLLWRSHLFTLPHVHCERIHVHRWYEEDQDRYSLHEFRLFFIDKMILD